ncbi:hypothetical protein Lal_00045253 [Lupinus albus]|nr:hypothetical protein Lal_00045253 [Lupinus albus]
MCALLRCRPGLTVPRWVVVGIPRTCRGFSCDPFCTEGCGARCCSNGHGRSTKGQVSKHPEVHFWRLNMVEAMARLWLRPSATCPLLPVPRKSTKGQVPKHPEVHPGRFNTVEPWGGRGRINQQCFSCRLVPRESVLLRCRPGLTVQSWFVAGIPRNCRAFYCGTFCTEGCGARGELPACPRTLVGQDGVPWGSLPAPQQAFPSMLVRFSMAMWEIRPSQK